MRSIWPRVKAAIQRIERENAAEREAPLQRHLFVVGRMPSKADELRILNRHALWAECMSRPGHDGPFAA